MNKSKKKNPNVHLSERTKHHVMAKSGYVHRSYDAAVMAMSHEVFQLRNKVIRLGNKNQLLLEALSKTVEAIECCEGCR
jgi:hypothetical protein